jgi:hypothetical protein
MYRAARGMHDKTKTQVWHAILYAAACVTGSCTTLYSTNVSNAVVLCRWSSKPWTKCLRQ